MFSPSIKSWLIPLVGLLALLTLLQTKIFFHAGVPYTHDGENHLARFANYKLAVKEGQFPPRFAPNLVNRYGYPVFNYNYPLANIVSLPFSLVKIPYSLTFKLIMAGSVVGGLIGAWRLSTRFTTSLRAQLFSLCVFGLSPYLTTALLYRGNIGEVMALCLMPWLFLIIENLREVETPRTSWRMLLGIGIGTAFLLAHNVTAVFGIPLLFGYALLRLGKDTSRWITLSVIFVAAISLSVWFWIPALAEKSLVILDSAALSQEYAQHFPSLNQLLFSPMTFGFSYAGSVDSLTMSIGTLQLAVLILSGILLLKDRQQKNRLLIGAGVLVSLLLILMQLPQSYLLWQILPMVRFIQFPWRLSIFLTVPLVILAAVIFDHLSRPTRWLVVGLIAIQAAAIARITAIDYVYKTDVDYEGFTQSTTTAHENTPKEFTFDGINQWQPAPTLVTGNAEILVDYWKGSDRMYRIEAKTPVVVSEPTMNFAGWQTDITPEGQGSQRVAYTNDGDVKGRVAYALEPGVYQVRSRFTQWTWPRIVGNTISLIAAGGVGMWSVLLLKNSMLAWQKSFRR